VSLDARISIPAPSATLPTPPSHNPTSPDPLSDHTRFVANFLALTDDELNFVAGMIRLRFLFRVHVTEVCPEALSILLEYYNAQDFAPQIAQLSLVRVEPSMNCERDLTLIRYHRPR
jgi:cyclin K